MVKVFGKGKEKVKSGVSFEQYNKFVLKPIEEKIHEEQKQVYKLNDDKAKLIGNYLNLMVKGKEKDAKRIKRLERRISKEMNELQDKIEKRNKMWCNEYSRALENDGNL